MTKVPDDEINRAQRYQLNDYVPAMLVVTMTDKPREDDPPEFAKGNRLVVMGETIKTRQWQMGYRLMRSDHVILMDLKTGTILPGEHIFKRFEPV